MWLNTTSRIVKGGAVAIRVECPNCKQTLEAPDEFVGRVAICPACRTRVQIPSSQSSAAPPTRPPAVTASEVFLPSATPQFPATTPSPTTSVDRIESIASDIRAELRTLNRRLGCLIILIAVVAAIGFFGAYTLLHGIGQLGQIGPLQ
jgi:hypothetical protein